MLGRPRVRWAASGATVVTLAITTTMLVGIVALAGGGIAAQRETGALDPSSLSFSNPLAAGVFSLGLFSGGEAQPQTAAGGASAETISAADAARSVRRFAIVVYTLGPFGWLLEALITAAIAGYIARVRPSLLWEGALGEIEAVLPAHEVGMHR